MSLYPTHFSIGYIIVYVIMSFNGFLDTLRMNFSFLAVGAVEITTTCKAYGCDKGGLINGKVKGGCFQTLKCTNCQERRADTAEGFCLALPSLGDNIFLLDGVLHFEGSEEGGTEEEQMAMQMAMQGGGAGYIQLRGEEEHGEGGGEGEPGGEPGGSWLGQIPGTLLSYAAVPIYAVASMLGSVPTKTFQLRFRPVTPGVSRALLQQCERTSYGTVSLSLEFYFAQKVSEKPEFKSDVDLRTRFTGITPTRGEQCFAPATLQTPIRRTDFIKIAMNIPVSVAQFNGFLANFPEAMKKRIEGAVTCQGCQPSDIMTCVRVQCKQASKQMATQVRESVKRKTRLDELRESAKAKAPEVITERIREVGCSVCSGCSVCRVFYSASFLRVLLLLFSAQFIRLMVEQKNLEIAKRKEQIEKQKAAAKALEEHYKKIEAERLAQEKKAQEEAKRKAKEDEAKRKAAIPPMQVIQPPSALTVSRALRGVRGRTLM